MYVYTCFGVLNICSLFTFLGSLYLNIEDICVFVWMSGLSVGYLCLGVQFFVFMFVWVFGLCVVQCLFQCLGSL